MVRISVSLVSILLSILFAAHALGLIPDRAEAVGRGRVRLSETLAIHCSAAVQRGQVDVLRQTFPLMVRRERDVLSAGVRTADGQLLVEVGDHEEAWKEGTGPAARVPSTLTHMHVPVALGDRPWGTVELRFKPVEPWGAVAGGRLGLFGFVAVAGFFAFFLYLRRVLRHVDLSQVKVVPERVRAALNTVAEGVLVLDRDQRIALANDAFARLLGEPADELQGRRASELPWSGPEAVVGDYPWVRAVRDGQSQVGRLLGLRALAGGLREVSVNSTPIVADDGTCRGALATFDDLTPAQAANARLRKLLRYLRRSRDQIHRQNEELRRAKQAAESASRAKGEFLANVSHEIRTPLNGILGMTEFMLNTPSSPEQQEYLQIVQASANALLTLINDILDLSKIEAGKFELDRVEFDLREVLGDTLKALALKAHQKGIELCGGVGACVPAVLVGDPGRLRQVLVNLVGNAIKFTDRGEVVVRVQSAECRVQNDRQEKDTTADSSTLHSALCTLHFEVRDTGIGIPADKLGAIFAPFEQGDGSVTRKYGGTGLGLAISRRLVGLMGGRIWVESVPGVGSTFHFTAQLALPRTPPAAPPCRLAHLSGRRALLVEDNAAQRELLEALLAHGGMAPVAVESPQAARAVLERCREGGAGDEPFALALLDSTLPGADPFSLAEEIRRHPALDGPVVLMLSSADWQTDIRRCQEVGAGYAIKPLKEADLVKVLDRGPVGGGSEEGPLALEAAPLPRMRILLVDDNVFNQRVGVLKLEQKGQSVRAVGSGRQALDALAQERFDLVFMDLQMPDMDGYDVTGVIRAREREAGGHVPVIALTAAGMKGDRARCQEAGMDGYLTKPVEDRALWQVLRTFAPAAPPLDSDRMALGRLPSPNPTLHSTALLGQVGGNAQLLNELVGLFHQEGEPLVEEIRAAVRGNECGRLERAAHRLQSMLGFFGARAATQTAVRLEEIGREGRFEGAQEACVALEAEMESVCSALAGLNGKAGT